MDINQFGKLNGKGFKIAIVQARFNETITDGMADGARKALKEAGVSEKNVKVLKVPGSFEIPLFCQKIAKSKKFDGIIAIGAVIKGETAHFDHIARAVTDGVMEVMLNNSLAITLGVITTYDLKQAEARAQDDANNKGYEAAKALVELIERLKDLKI